MKGLKLILPLLSLIFFGCSPEANTEDTFSNVERISIEKMNLDGSKELIIELTQKEELDKISGFVNLDENGIVGCDLSLLITFHKPNTIIEGYTNLKDNCMSIAYTYNSNFYTKKVSAEGANYLKLMTGIF